jgi:hypothetical protein
MLAALTLTYQFGPLHERSWHKQAIGKIPPGRSAEVSSWMELLKKKGLDFPNASLMPQSVVLYTSKERTSEGRTKWIGPVVFLERRGDRGGMAESPSFQIRAYRSNPDEPDPELALRVAEELQFVDTGSFFLSRRGETFPMDSVHAQPEPEALVRASIHFCCWWLFLLLLCFVGQRILSGRKKLSRDSQIFLALTILAVGLRLLVEPGAVHANEHAAREVGALFPASLAPGDAWPDGGYGFGASGFLRFLSLVTGSTDSGLFVWMAVVMGLGTPLVGLTLRALGASDGRVYLASLVYALTPIVVRAAPTESTLVLSVLLMMASLVCLCRARDSESSRSPYWLIAAACAALAVQMHVVTIVWMLPIGLAPLWVQGDLRRRAWLTVGLVFLLCGPHLIHTVDHVLLGEVDAPNPFLRLAQQWGHAGIAPLNPFLVPFGLTALALFSLLQWRLKPALVMILTIGGYLALSASTTQTLSDVLRYQSALTVLLIVVALVGKGSLGRARAPSLTLPTGFLITLVSLTFFPTLYLVSVPDPEGQLISLVEEAGSEGLLDQGLQVPNTSDRKQTRLQPARPSWALPSHAPREVAPDALILVTTGCVIQPDEGARETNSLDRGCRKALGKEIRAVKTLRKLPEGFAGLPLWFHPRRPGAPAPGLYHGR